MTPLRSICVGVLVLAGCAGNAAGPTGPGYDCRVNAPGNGNLSADIVGRWFFVQNSSPQYFDFRADGTATRTWTSDEHDDVRYTLHDYVVEGDTVAIGGYDRVMRFVLGDDGRWTVPDRYADSDWTRCLPDDGG